MRQKKKKSGRIQAWRLLPLCLMALMTMFNVVSQEIAGRERYVKVGFRARNVVADIPKKAKGWMAEKFEYFKTARPDSSEFVSGEVYPDRMVVFTNDVETVMKVIGNPEQIMEIQPVEDEWTEIRVYAENADAGIRLRERLKDMPCVSRVANHIRTETFEHWAYGGLFVKLKCAGDSLRFRSIADSLGLRAYGPDGYRQDLWDLYMPASDRRSVMDVQHSLIKEEIVKSCEINLGYVEGPIKEFTYDPDIDKQWGLYNRNNLTIPENDIFTDLDIARAWDFATGRGVTIAVIDEGFDTANKDLKGNIKACYDATTGKNTITMNDSHGNACAGIAAAIRDNDYGMSGVAPDAKLLLARYSNNDAIVGGERLDNTSATIMARPWHVQP